MEKGVCPEVGLVREEEPSVLLAEAPGDAAATQVTERKPSRCVDAFGIRLWHHN